MLMKNLHRISLILIAIPLAATLWSSHWMIPFVQPERAEIRAGTLHYMFSYENFVHEDGFARLTLSIIGLLIVLIPYRRGERWALAALVTLLFCYQLPVFLFGSIPNLGTWPIFRKLPEPRSPSLAMMMVYVYLMPALTFAGLALALPRFLRGQKS